MLAITRKAGESFRLRMPDGSEAWITVVGIRYGEVRIGISAPREIVVARAELVPEADRPAFVEVRLRLAPSDPGTVETPRGTAAGNKAK